MIKTCPHCGETDDYEDGHSCWICKHCDGFFDEVDQVKTPLNED